MKIGILGGALALNVAIISEHRNYIRVMIPPFPSRPKANVRLAHIGLCPDDQPFKGNAQPAALYYASSGRRDARLRLVLSFIPHAGAFLWREKARQGHLQEYDNFLTWCAAELANYQTSMPIVWTAGQCIFQKDVTAKLIRQRKEQTKLLFGQGILHPPT